MSKDFQELHFVPVKIPETLPRTRGNVNANVIVCNPERRIHDGPPSSWALHTSASSPIERAQQAEATAIKPWSPPMSSGERVLPFSSKPAEFSAEEKARRVRAEAERLAGLAEVDWKYQLKERANHFGVEESILRQMVVALVRDREKQAQREKAEEQRREKQCFANQKREACERQREQDRADQEAQRKHREKERKFTKLTKLPRAERDARLAELAVRLGEDAAVLRQEFEEFIDVGCGEVSTEKTEPWPDPVNTAELLQECSNKISKHVVIQEHQLTAAVLWDALAWLYDHDVPTHSPILAATSAEADSGKSTLVVVVGRMAPRFSLNIEITGPTLYRTIDATKPTLALDEADDLFNRRSDLKHIVNAGWTRGAKIPRQVNIGGVWTTVYFDCFTPKLIALLGRNLPPPTRTRCIELRVEMKRKDEQVEEFNQLDDAEFAVLRRKFARWAADHAMALKDVKPTMPTGLNNRAAANWKLLLAIADALASARA
jgi:hypothetical protein